MLILTRRPEEVIRVGDEITITLLGIKGNQVRIGIEAPRAIPVHRLEIYNRIQAEAEHHAISRVASHPPSLQVVSPEGEVPATSSELGQGTKRLP